MSAPGRVFLAQGDKGGHERVAPDEGLTLVREASVLSGGEFSAGGKGGEHACTAAEEGVEVLEGAHAGVVPARAEVPPRFVEEDEGHFGGLGDAALTGVAFGQFHPRGQRAGQGQQVQLALRTEEAAADGFLRGRQPGGSGRALLLRAAEADVGFDVLERLLADAADGHRHASDGGDEALVARDTHLVALETGEQPRGDAHQGMARGVVAEGVGHEADACRLELRELDESPHHAVGNQGHGACRTVGGQMEGRTETMQQGLDFARIALDENKT